MGRCFQPHGSLSPSLASTLTSLLLLTTSLTSLSHVMPLHRGSRTSLLLLLASCLHVPRRCCCCRCSPAPRAAFTFALLNHWKQLKLSLLITFAARKGERELEDESVRLSLLVFEWKRGDARRNQRREERGNEGRERERQPQKTKSSHVKAFLAHTFDSRSVRYVF